MVSYWLPLVSKLIASYLGQTQSLLEQYNVFIKFLKQQVFKNETNLVSIYLIN